MNTEEMTPFERRAKKLRDEYEQAMAGQKQDETPDPPVDPPRQRKQTKESGD